MQWNHLTSLEDVQKLRERSATTHCLIFKHSVRCPVSSIVRSRLEAAWSYTPDQITPYFIDLIRYRSVSNAISDIFQVYHESPQMLLIHQDNCILDASHLDIDLTEISEVAGFKPQTSS